MPPQKVQKVMTQPINLIFRFLQSKSIVQVWLYENANLRIEGVICGFDEYMNLVLDEAVEVRSFKPIVSTGYWTRRSCKVLPIFRKCISV